METNVKYRLETERLRARELTLDDTELTIRLLNSPGWMKFIGDRHVQTGEQARAYLQNGPLKSYREHGYGMFLVESKEMNEPIGMCGLLKRENLPYPDLGFAFLPEYHGKGYAREIADATLTYASKELGLSSVSAIVLPANDRSIRLLEKLGFEYVKAFTFAGSEEELLLFVRNAEA